MEGDGAVDDAAAESKGTGEVNININCYDWSKFSVQISLESTVESFREVIAQKRDISPDQRLIYKGRFLRNDHQTLNSYGLEDGGTVYLTRAPAPAATINPTGGTTGSTNSTRSPSLTKDPTNATMMAGAGTQGGQASNPSTNFSSTSSEAIARSSSPNTSPLPNPWTSTRVVSTASAFDPTSFGLLMQNPATLRKRQQILSNPTAVMQFIHGSSEKHGMPDLSPYIIPLFVNPATFQQALLSQLIEQRSTRESDRAVGVQDPIISSIPSNMSRGLGTGSPAVPNSNSDEPPEQLYVTQLSQLQAMGFSDTQENTMALTATSGDVLDALLQLLDNSDVRTTWGFDPTSIDRLMQNQNTLRRRQIILSNPTAAVQDFRAFSKKHGLPDVSRYLIPLFLNPALLQQAILSQFGQQQSTQESGRAADVQDPIIPPIPSNMSHGLGTSSPAVPNSNSDEPPEILYATQLSQLQEMGFSDTQENIRALIATSGNVHEAVKRLSRNSGQ